MLMLTFLILIDSRDVTDGGPIGFYDAWRSDHDWREQGLRCLVSSITLGAVSSLFSQRDNIILWPVVVLLFIFSLFVVVLFDCVILSF